MNSFSVVIPSLNECEYLPACLASLASNVSGEPPEIIVVDAGSTDGTVDLAVEAGALVLQVPKTTIAAQRNQGAASAKHDLIAFLDGDCTVLPDWSANAIKHFSSSDVVSVGAPPQVPETDVTWVQSTWSYITRSLLDEVSNVHWLPSANVWVRKASFQEVDGFDESLETCEDADLGFRLGKVGRIVCDPRVAVIHHREPRTLVALYQKEVWHGKNSYSGTLKGRFTPAELPSLVAPIIFGSFVIMLLVSAILMPTFLTLGTAFCGLCLLPAVYTIRALMSKGELWRLLQVFVVYLVYFAARTHAALAEFLRVAVRFPKRFKSAASTGQCFLKDI